MKAKAKKTAAGSGQWCVLILAAGEGTRMESDRPKVLHSVGGNPIIYYVLRLANALKPSAVGLVVGHKAEEVQKEVEAMARAHGFNRPLSFIRQKERTGSGGAILQSLPFLRKFQTVVVLCGDAPLISIETMTALVNHHRDQKNQVTLLTARLPHPKGYGRIVRGPMGDVLKIVEESEATVKEAAIQEVNSGAYCFELPILLETIHELKPMGPKREQYLTHALELIRRKGGRIAAYVTPSAEEILGINNRIQLAQVERIANRRTLERLMLSGVTMTDPSHVYVDAEVEVGRETVLLPGVILKGRAKIGPKCRIGPYSWIEDSVIESGCEIRSSQVVGSKVLEDSTVGPYANLRPGTVAGPRAKIGNFTEIKASHIGPRSKVPHLSYVGDAAVAEDVNVGAGTITCNFDGKEKHRTVIRAKAFIGSNVNLVAPVVVGRGAKIGAGSTITENVPDGSLAIGRARQINKAD